MQDSQSLLKQAYQGLSTTLDTPDLAKALQGWYHQHRAFNFLHPCVIEGRPALVCQADLGRLSPTAYAELQAIALRYGIFLKEDGRRRDQTTSHNRRRAAGIVLSFWIGVLASSRLVCADELDAQYGQTVAAALLQPTLAPEDPPAGNLEQPVIRLRKAKPPTAAEVMAAYDKRQLTLQADVDAIRVINDFLQQHYQAEAGDPAHVAADLLAFAEYYARYPQVIALIKEFSGHSLRLHYQANTWQTQAWGGEWGVDRVSVSFDTRLGAQLLGNPGCESSPACGITPADALLHELLHAKLMLTDSAHFIASGAMKPGIYPFEHEHEVLELENRLYAEMNQYDSLARPIRHRHAGQLLPVTCPLCNPNNPLQTAQTQ